MDLRVRKTLRNLHQAFMTLRKEKALEHITVKELVEAAEISKATFYLHYKDIYDLSDYLQQQVIEKILSSAVHPNWSLTDSAAFTRSLAMAFIENEKEIDVLFSGGQASLLPQSIEQGIREHILRTQPALAGDPVFQILLTYQVYGSCHAFAEHRGDCDLATLTDTLSRSSALLFTPFAQGDSAQKN